MGIFIRYPEYYSCRRSLVIIPRSVIDEVPVTLSKLSVNRGSISAVRYQTWVSYNLTVLTSQPKSCFTPISSVQWFQDDFAQKCSGNRRSWLHRQPYCESPCSSWAPASCARQFGYGKSMGGEMGAAGGRRHLRRSPRPAYSSSLQNRSRHPFGG